MSYNVYVVEAPIPEDDDSAWAVMELVLSRRDAEQGRAVPAVFDRLIDELLARYPCITESDGPPAWNSGPVRGSGEHSVLVLGIIDLDGLLPFAIERANALGLVVFDEQVGVIHRCEGSSTGWWDAPLRWPPSNFETTVLLPARWAEELSDEDRHEFDDALIDSTLEPQTTTLANDGMQALAIRTCGEVCTFVDDGAFFIGSSLIGEDDAPESMARWQAILRRLRHQLEETPLEFDVADDTMILFGDETLDSLRGDRDARRVDCEPGRYRVHVRCEEEADLGEVHLVMLAPPTGGRRKRKRKRKRDRDGAPKRKPKGVAERQPELDSEQAMALEDLEPTEEELLAYQRRVIVRGTLLGLAITIAIIVLVVLTVR